MLIALPLLVVPVVLYNIVVLSGALGGVTSDGSFLAAEAALREPIFSIPMASGASWGVGAGDLILFLSLLLLFFELLKSTSSQKIAIVNHALSILFVVCLVEFLLVQGFATSVFFLILTMVLLDVLAGFIVTIVASRKDFDFGGR